MDFILESRHQVPSSNEIFYAAQIPDLPGFEAPRIMENEMVVIGTGDFEVDVCCAGSMMRNLLYGEGIVRVAGGRWFVAGLQRCRR